MTEGTGDCPIDESRLEPLHERQKAIYSQQLTRFQRYLRTSGKDPVKEIGFAEDTIPPRVSRFHRAVEWIWEHEKLTTEFSTAHGITILEALNEDTFRTEDGERYSEGSKRKFADVLRNWFEFQGEEWDPTITFSDETATNSADPFSKQELRDLWQAALTYKSIPTYNNLDPDERDRWKAYLAQELGKPKEEVTPSDWEAVNTSWDVPALIRTTRSAGWRPKMVGRLRVDWYDPAAETISIPRGCAVKNDAAWDQQLDDESAMALENWLDQRRNMELYADCGRIWLTREGNPHSSSTVNSLLKNLMSEADIHPRDRNLSWYSFRHSIGTYLYEEFQDLAIVAEVLRQKSRSSASRYVHPTPELKREAAEVM